MNKYVNYTSDITVLIISFFLLLSLNYGLLKSVIFSVIPFVNLYFVFKHTVGITCLIVYYITLIYAYAIDTIYKKYFCFTKRNLIDKILLQSSVISIFISAIIYIIAIIKAIIIIV